MCSILPISWIDIPALAGATGAAFVAHDGLAQIGPLRWLCALNDTVFVSRTNRLGIAGQINELRDALAETWAITIFPEGTTTDGSKLLPFKSPLLQVLDPPPPGRASTAGAATASEATSARRVTTRLARGEEAIG